MYRFLLLIFVMSSCGTTANFRTQAKTLKAPATVDFYNESKKAKDYIWDFGDGTTSTEENPTHQYYLSGRYTVKLQSINGNRKTIKKQIIDIEAPDSCLVLIETDYGNMLAYMHEETPKHRANFIKLADRGFYDSLLFHRVINGFMIQGGDPKSRNAKPGSPLGSGGPGYTVDAEFNKKLVHIKGAIAAARTGDRMNPERKSSGSQFYIVHGKPLSENQIKDFELSKNIKYSEKQKEILTKQGGTPFLDMNYTVFGQVIDGLEVIDKIAEAQGDNTNRPNKDIRMKVRVIK